MHNTFEELAKHLVVVDHYDFSAAAPEEADNRLFIPDETDANLTYHQTEYVDDDEICGELLDINELKEYLAGKYGIVFCSDAEASCQANDLFYLLDVAASEYKGVTLSCEIPGLREQFNEFEGKDVRIDFMNTPYRNNIRIFGNREEAEKYWDDRK